MRGKTTGSAARAFLVAIAAFAAGVGAGWLMFAGGAEQDAPAAATAPAAAPASQPQTESVRATPRQRAPTPQEGDVRLDDEGERLAKDALSAPADFKAPTGDGVIRGTVRDDAGAPLAGVEITGRPSRPEAWSKEIDGVPWFELPVETRIRRFVRDQRWMDATRKSIRTGADGTYALTGLGDCTWSMSATMSGYSFRRAERARSDAVRPGDVADFVAQPEIAVEFDVRLADGTPVESVSVTLAQSNSSTSTTVSGARASLSVKPGPYRATAVAGRDQRFAAAPVDVEVKHGMKPVVMTLRPRPGVIVTAKRPDGFATMRPRIFLRRADGTEPSDDDLRVSKGRSGRWLADPEDESRSDRMAFLDLAPGEWIVAAGLDGAPLARRVVTVGDGLVECELTVPAPDPSQFVEVHVTRPDGTPADTASLGWEYRAARESASYSASAVARGAGVWLVRRVGPQDHPNSSSRSGAHDPNGRWFLTATVAGLGSQEAEAAAGATRIDVALVMPAIAVVRVKGLTRGADVTRFSAMIEVGAGRLKGGDLAADGSRKLEPVSPGPRIITLDLDLDESGSLTIAQRTVNLVAGENVLDLDVPPLHPLDLDLGASQAEDRVTMDFTADDGASDTIYVGLDRAGRAKFDLVPAGRYRVDVDGKEHEFRVPETRTFKLP